jgi:hypothetical protein
LCTLTATAKAGDPKAVAAVVDLINTVKWDNRSCRNVIERED